MARTDVYIEGRPSYPYQENKIKEPTVATPCHEFIEMAIRWELPEDLMGGTLKMRKERTKWLPQEPKEDLGAYNNRLNRTVLYGAYKRTVMALAGLPFINPVATEEIPQELAYLKEDADSMGADITNLAFSLLKDQIHLGLTHILVDMPAIEGNVTLQQQKDYKIRPYFSHISPLNLISWNYEKIGGLINLTEIRIKEEVYVKQGRWGESEYKQIRVVTPDSFEIWREVEKDKWDVVESLPNNLGYIPLITIYGNQEEYMTAEPPLEDLAWLNLRHYQKLSDQDNILHVASVPILAAYGVDDGALEGVSIGPNTLVNFSNTDSKLEYVEHSGNAIGAAEKSLERLEERMAAMGADLIIRKSVDRQTATSRKIDQSESISLLQVMINNLESGLQKAVKIAGDWIDLKDAKSVFNIGDGLDTGGEGGPNFIDNLLTFIQKNKGMDVMQAINELKRRGSLSDTYKLPENQEEIVEPVDNPAEEIVEPGVTPVN